DYYCQVWDSSSDMLF
nr:immunoglobulin light chain junction region [Macaca mulatta]MOX19598.1 immunoglobulin light chain junction region [Macaca mulatta]MOX21342.1 immunoglobulin light chain junction region [Macaca mulatta]MOX23058.1 immunoglobulin light chain junction region [Macaca mulatta]MOX23411.1 immunoglobulin light chain junction region [Macaca mulatta]